MCSYGTETSFAHGEFVSKRSRRPESQSGKVRLSQSSEAVSGATAVSARKLRRVKPISPRTCCNRFTFLHWNIGCKDFVRIDMFCTKCGVELRDQDRYCSMCGTATANAPVPATPGKRLMRSRYDSKIAGVCGGIGQYMNVDPTFVRLIFLVLLLTPPGIGLIAYIVGWIVIPKEPERISGTLTPAPV